MAEKESSLGDFFLELFPSVDLAYAFVTELQCLCIYICLYIIEKCSNHICNSLLRMR